MSCTFQNMYLFLSFHLVVIYFYFFHTCSQCENGLVVGQRPADTCLRFLISAFKAFSLDAVLAVTTI